MRATSDRYGKTAIVSDELRRTGQDPNACASALALRMFCARYPGSNAILSRAGETLTTSRSNRKSLARSHARTRKLPAR
eukprot:3311055-Rhodomonas_salina.1